MPNSRVVAGLLVVDFCVFGLFPSYMVAHLFAFQVVPGPPVVSEVGGVVSALFYFSVYPLEMWAPWIFFPGLIPPVAGAAIAALSVAVLRGRQAAINPLLVTVAAYNGAEVLGSGYAMFLTLSNILIGNGAFVTMMAWAVVPFVLRLVLAALAIAVNRRVLRAHFREALAPAA